MYALIQYKDGNGRWVSPCLRDRAHLLLSNVHAAGQCGVGGLDAGWLWLRDRLADWCLEKAQDCGGKFEYADKWIARYLAIRVIK